VRIDPNFLTGAQLKATASALQRNGDELIPNEPIHTFGPFVLLNVFTGDVRRDDHIGTRLTVRLRGRAVRRALEAK
jgi:hypothetical protein